MSTIGHAQTNGKLFSTGKLSCSDVTCVTQDGYGYIWIGTTYGLDRFDGYRFYNYRHSSSDSTSIPQNEICTLLCDSQGRLWVGTGKGLARYDFKRNAFVNIHFPRNLYPRVNSIIETKKGDFYVGTAGMGIFYIKKGTDTLIEEKSFFNLVQDNFLSRLHEDKQGSIWCKSRGNELYQFTVKGGKATQVRKHLPVDGAVQEIMTDADGKLLTVYSKRIMFFDNKDKNWKDAGFILESITKEADIRHALITHSGDFYIGTSGHGIFVFPKGQKTSRVVNFRDKLFQLSESTTSALAEDRFGNLWIGCFLKGVALLSKQQTAFHAWTFSPTDTSLNNSQISSVAQADNNGLWCSVWYQGLYLFDSDGKVAAHPNTPHGTSLIYRGNDGSYWIGAENGFFTFDPQSGNTRQVFKSSEWLNSACDAGQWLFVSEFGQGFIRYDKQTGEIKRYYTRMPGDGGHLCNNWVYTMLIDRQGYMWISTARGLSCLNLADDNFRSLGWEVLLDSIACGPMCIDSKNNVIIGTNAGIFIYDRKQNKAFPLPHGEALTDTRICGIQCDEEDNLWISTPIGIWQYEAKTKKTIAYNSGNGQVTGEYLNGISIRTKSGMIAFGISNGLTTFYPKEIKNIHHEIGTVHITDININGQWVSPEQEYITVPYDENNFSISASLFDFMWAEDISYEYRINGGEWQGNITDTNTFPFNRVRPGKYIIDVRAKFGNHYSTEYATVTIKVENPWYGSPWAYLCYAILLGTVIIAIFRYYTRMKRMELNDEKMKFLMNTTHDIRSPLTLIMGPLAKLKDAVKDNNCLTYIETIDRNAQRLLLLVNQILDERKLDKNQMHLHCRETNMVGFISNICKLYQYTANQRNITFSIEHESDYLIAWIDRTQFDKVISNLLSNAFKYTYDGGEIKIKLKETCQNLEIEIIDNGIGIKDSEINHLFDRFYQGKNNLGIGMQGTGIGLNLSRSIVELHGGKIKARHRTDGQQGTSFVVTIPLGNKHLKPSELLIDTPVRQVISESKGNQTFREFCILIADDDVEIADYIMGELGGKYKFTHCLNGKEALKELLTHTYNLVISDVMMPEMDGIALLKQIKSNPNTIDLPVILLTSKAEISDKLEGLKKGADAYIAKPFNMEELHIQIDNLINNVRRLRGKFSGASSQAKRVENIEVVSNNDALMERIMKSVNANMSNPDYNVDALAADIGMSRAQLHRKMKEMTGISTGKFIRNIRMEQAARLIKEEKINISQVAYSVGFSDQTHFSTVFKSYFGKTPSNYAEDNNQ